MNFFRKFWLAAKVKAALGGNVDAIKSIVGWLLKSKWLRGHRRQVSVGLTVATALLALFTGPVAAVIPALGDVAIQKVLISVAAYIGLIGEMFKNDPVP